MDKAKCRESLWCCLVSLSRLSVTSLLLFVTDIVCFSSFRCFYDQWDIESI